MGYCNDFPELTEHIAFVKKYAPWYDFLQFNGFSFRSEQEIREILSAIKESGIRLIDLTFYGTREYHDRFAGRQGDFEFLLRILKIAQETNLSVVVSIALTEENKDQMQALFEVLDQYKIKQYTVFLPHAKGRGERISHLRLTKDSYQKLPQVVRDNFMRIPHQTEAQWISQGSFPKATKRALTLALREENIDRLEKMAPADIIAQLERIDDAYYAAMPTMEELAALYGRPDNQQLFRLRDLYLEWQKRYLREQPITVPDMNDECNSFSVRYYE